MPDPAVRSSSHGDAARRRILSDILRLQALRNPDRLALVYEGRRDTFAELNVLVNRAANGLRAAGIRPGDKVAIFSHNNRAYVLLRFAIIRAGAVFVPVNFMLGPSEVGYILRHSDSRFILAEDALCATAEEALVQIGGQGIARACLRHLGVAPPPGWIDGDKLFDFPDAEEPRPDRDEGDPVQIMYTSGTESRPKGALLNSRALMSHYASCIIDGEMSAGDVELHCLPLYHCAQLDCFLSVDLYLGATSVLLRAPEPAIILATIEAERINKFFAPPTVWISLLRHPDFDRRDLSTLAKGYYGASIMPTAIIEELTERLPSLRLWNFYGQTEMSPLATVLKPEHQMTRVGSAGKPCLNVETRVVDDDGSDVAPGEVGEIVHRSPHAMLGYLNDEEKTAEVFRDGWFHSGDLGRLDGDGFLYIVDRKKDMIKSGGENVASREVEEELFHHPAVAEVAVLGLPDPYWVEAVVAVVVRKRGAEVDDAMLDAYCRERLAAYKRPKRFFFLDALPKNASGKVLKRELREQLSRGGGTLDLG
ncbi:fatty acyl-CoA synthetase [Sphingobium sp. CFD-2]|uniref:fatty acyl-CoA synthetase n=1 Tax=Sphingobium sp. CFD-2 TaxID=2878542 RepID=UPI00214BAE4D|nr:fatty acyl-CoA synthetase [Sphingobium sp. CFD-2]